jgi:hypothetical protein
MFLSPHDLAVHPFVCLGHWCIQLVKLALTPLKQLRAQHNTGRQTQNCQGIKLVCKVWLPSVQPSAAIPERVFCTPGCLYQAAAY